MKLLPSRRKFCVHHTTMLHVTSCKATYVRCMCVLAVTCHLHFWQSDWGLLRATAVTRGWNGYRNKSQHRKLTLEKFSRRSCRDSNPRPFDHESGVLTTELSPPPGYPIFRCRYAKTIPNFTCFPQEFRQRAAIEKDTRALNGDPNTETVKKNAYLLGHKHTICRCSGNPVC